MRKTAYFSLALMLAAVVFVARFGARPEAARLAQTTTRASARATVPTTAIVPATAVPTSASPATRTPARSSSSTATATEMAGPSATPDVVSRSGADRPATPLETPERYNGSGRAASLVAPTVTPSPTALPPTLTRSPSTRPPAATTGARADSGDSTAPWPPERIVAPTIALDSKIVPVGWHKMTNPDGSEASEWDVASFAVSWHKTSAKVGEAGNTVLTGHNNIEGEVFRHLEHLNVGDPITLYAGGRVRQYKVTDRFIVREEGVPYEQRLENAKWINSFPDERITLMSCWPYTGDTHRIFIIAKPVAGG